MRIVLDTNVLVSGLLNPSGKPAVVINHMFADRLQLCFDSRVIDEYERVLLRPAFCFRKEDIRNLLTYLQYTGLLITPQPIPHELADPYDRPFMEVAVAGNCPIVTGNSKHFPKDLVPILSPSEFLDKWF